MALIPQNGLVSAILTGLTQAVAGTPAENLLNGCKIGLFTGTPVISTTNLLADFTAPVNTGLGLSSAITWGAPYTDADGTPSMSSNSVMFLVSAATGTDSITGYYLVASSGSPTVPLAVEMLSTPLIVSKVGDGFLLVVNLEISGKVIGDSNVIN